MLSISRNIEKFVGRIGWEKERERQRGEEKRGGKKFSTLSRSILGSTRARASSRIESKASLFCEQGQLDSPGYLARAE